MPKREGELKENVQCTCAPLGQKTVSWCPGVLISGVEMHTMHTNWVTISESEMCLIYQDHFRVS